VENTETTADEDAAAGSEDDAADTTEPAGDPAAQE